MGNSSKQQAAGSSRRKGKAPVLTASVDYLEFTLPADRLYDAVRLFPSVVSLDRGFRGYTSSASVGEKGFLAWAEERPEMGVHCSLGSQALGILADLDDRWADLPRMLAHLRDDLGGHVTRIDIAWDDKDGALDLDVMEKAALAEEFTSRWKGGYQRRGWGNQAGETMYWGSAYSDSMLRVYNKRKERIAKGHAEEVEGVDHWVRVELQLRRKRADKAAELFQGVSEAPGRVFSKLAGILRGYIEFKVPSATDSNKRRWAPAEWWVAFLGYVSKARLKIEKVKRTVQRAMAIASQQWAPMLAVFKAALGEDGQRSFLDELTVEGRSRWRKKHVSMLQDWRKDPIVKAAGLAA